MVDCSPAKAGAQAAAKQRFPLPWTMLKTHRSQTVLVFNIFAGAQ
jgi:hypothetical protein